MFALGGCAHRAKFAEAERDITSIESFTLSTQVVLERRDNFDWPRAPCGGERRVTGAEIFSIRKYARAVLERRDNFDWPRAPCGGERRVTGAEIFSIRKYARAVLERSDIS
jgi:hypothetical protein